ncbi:MAG: molecular chaperone [Pseudomonas sp.]
MNKTDDHLVWSPIIRSSILFFLSIFIMIPLSKASVVITGTRIIYPSDAKEVTVQLTNQDNFPNIVQAWVDINNPDSMPETADAPFIINPTVSRISPGSGQSLRVIFTGSDLPQDRESLFYLNVLQIPPRNIAKGDQNQMLLMLRNRLKLFYRPTTISGSPDVLPEKLRFGLIRSGNGWHVTVENPTGYHASFGGATLNIGKHKWQLKADMVPPLSTVEWRSSGFAKPLPTGKPQLRAQLINDYGARVDIRHDFSH